MIAQPQNQPTYSPETYLAQEVASDIRHEYIDGEIIPMTGGTPNHNRIIRNLCTALTVGLGRQDFEVFVADQRLWIPASNIYTYPDVMVVQGELAYQQGRRDTITNPLAIIEVLSQSTQNDDRGGKFVAYRTIATLQEYWLVDQYSYHLESYVKTAAKQWLFEEYDDPEAAVTLSSSQVTIALRDIYDKVEFAPPEDEPSAPIA